VGDSLCNLRVTDLGTDPVGRGIAKLSYRVQDVGGGKHRDNFSRSRWLANGAL
jgi:hypothetical protein